MQNFNERLPIVATRWTQAKVRTRQITDKKIGERKEKRKEKDGVFFTLLFTFSLQFCIFAFSLGVAKPL